MKQIDVILPKTIFILLDAKGKIQYCNMGNKKVAIKFLERFNIVKFLEKDDFIKKEIEDYIITVDKLSLEGKMFWLVTIEKEDSSLVYMDFSTGLFNKNYWEHIKSGIIKLPAVMSYYSIIVIDIDNLKELNDKYGHIEGDKVIEIVGYAIKKGIRDKDIAIHYGGDEYLIILPNTNEEGAKKVIKKIREIIVIKGEIEISAGIACSDCFYDFETVAQIADRKMYIEKRRKRK